MDKDKSIDYSLSDKDVNQIAEKPLNLILSENLYKYSNIDQLFNNSDSCLMLYEDSRTNEGSKIGHWVGLLKIDTENICFFDSFGDHPDDFLKTLPFEFKRDYNMVRKFLSELLIKSPYKHLHYNPYKYQKMDSNTCGRHVGFFLRCGIDPEEYKKLLKQLKTENEYDNYDDLIIDITNNFLN